MVGAVKGSEDVSGERISLLGRVIRPQSSSSMKGGGWSKRSKKFNDILK